jgi:hypothetical protein
MLAVIAFVFAAITWAVVRGRRRGEAGDPQTAATGPGLRPSAGRGRQRPGRCDASRHRRAGPGRARAGTAADPRESGLLIEVVGSRWHRHAARLQDLYNQSSPCTAPGWSTWRRPLAAVALGATSCRCWWAPRASRGRGSPSPAHGCDCWAAWCCSRGAVTGAAARHGSAPTRCPTLRGPRPRVRTCGRWA